MKGLSLVATLVLSMAGPAVAQDRPVLNGLESAMTEAALGLRDGERLRATKALDRALHLAEFAAASSKNNAEGTNPYEAALDTVKDARHALQNGRPDGAAGLLRTGAAHLSSNLVLAPELSGLDPDRPGDYEGRPVLSADGARLGKIGDFGRNDHGPVVTVEHGGSFGLGGEETPVPLRHLLAGERFLVLPEEGLSR